MIDQLLCSILWDSSRKERSPSAPQSIIKGREPIQSGKGPQGLAAAHIQYVEKEGIMGKRAKCWLRNAVSWLDISTGRPGQMQMFPARALHGKIPGGWHLWFRPQGTRIKAGQAGLFLMFKEPSKRFMTTNMACGRDKLEQCSPSSNRRVSLPAWSIKYLSPECSVGCHRLKFENLLCCNKVFNYYSGHWIICRLCKQRELCHREHPQIL